MVPEVEPKLAACKAVALPAVLCPAHLIQLDLQRQEVSLLTFYFTTLL